MHENAPVQAPAPPAGAAALRPVSPADGAVVADPVAIPFSWDAPDGGDAKYVLQVARDAAFEDVLATVTTGSSTAVTLYDTVPAREDGTLHWRVRADGQRQWSPPASFRVLAPETIAAQRARQEEAARARADAATRRATADIHRHLDDDNEHAVSTTYTAVVIAALIVSFLILLIILLIFGQVTYPPQAVV